MQVALVMFKSDGTRRDFPLAKQRVIIGRQNTCDLRVPLTSVSRQHCELIIEADTLRVRDLGSSNGTYHNSSRVQEAVLGPGDELVIGPVVFTVVIDGQPSQIKPVRTILDDAGESEVVSVKPPARPESAGSKDPAAGKSAGPAGRTVVTHSDPIYDLDADEDDVDGAAGPKGGGADDDELDLDDPLAALEALEDDEDAGEGSSLGEFEFLGDDDDDDKP